MLTTKQAREIVANQTKYYCTWTDKSRAKDGDNLRNVCFNLGYFQEKQVEQIKKVLKAAGHTGKTRYMNSYLRLTNLAIG